MTNKQKLQLLSFEMSDTKLIQTCETIFENNKFFYWPASLSFHHAYVGGLAAHTLEVCELADDLANSGLLQNVNFDVLITSALWHDFLKTEEYVLVNVPIEGQRALRICENGYEGFLTKREGKDATYAHIKDGAAKFVETAKNCGVEPSIIEQVEHCILSHHGFIKEWGSEVAPKTLEALFLHQADMLSAHGGKTK